MMDIIVDGYIISFDTGDLPNIEAITLNNGDRPWNVALPTALGSKLAPFNSMASLRRHVAALGKFWPILPQASGVTWLKTPNYIYIIIYNIV